jgi:hypothetical protein
MVSIRRIMRRFCLPARIQADVIFGNDKDLSGQLEALKAAGATTIYRENISGTRADRPQLAKLMAALIGQST